MPYVLRNVTLWIIRYSELTNCELMLLSCTPELLHWAFISWLKCIHTYIYIYIYTQWNLGSRTPLIMNKSVHVQIFRKKKKSRVTNSVLSNEHASRQQRLATSWEYQQESVSCCVTFTQYTSLLEFAVPSLEFHCVLCFLIYY
jgi:hypothetical protein